MKGEKTEGVLNEEWAETQESEVQKAPVREEANLPFSGHHRGLGMLYCGSHSKSTESCCRESDAQSRYSRSFEYFTT
jgi:hypothetical protein